MTRTGGAVEHINPDGLLRSPAFSHVVTVTGPVRTVYVGGQNAVTATGVATLAGPAVPGAGVEIEAMAVVPRPAEP
jgi:hypothetical protein